MKEYKKYLKEMEADPEHINSMIDAQMRKEQQIEDGFKDSLKEIAYALEQALDKENWVMVHNVYSDVIRRIKGEPK